MFRNTKNKFSKGLVILLIAGQLAFGFTFLLTPKPAKAFWGIGDFTFTTQVADWYDVFKDIGLAVVQRLAINYANKYLTRFVDKVIDKYRIKDYLAYDKVLSGYYLNQFVYQNVNDPDLRAIYGILATDINTRATVTDANGRTQPVLAALKQKLDSYYYNQGGINSNQVYYPGAAMRDQQYFAMAQAYFSNPPSFTQQTLYGQFGQMVTDSQKAAGQETAAGSGMKTDRSAPTGVVPHICKNFNAGPYQPGLDPRASEANCRAAGGTWDIDGTGIAQSVIQNPSAFIHDFATNAINSVFTNNFGAKDNIYSAIGSLLGNFIFNKLNLDTDSSSPASNGFDGTYNEKGASYRSDSGNAPPTREIDLDGDNIPDGQDVNGDGKLETIGVDTCYHGQLKAGDPGYVATKLTCKKSGQVTSSPYFTSICSAIDSADQRLTELVKFMDDNAGDLDGGAALSGKISGPILSGPVGRIFGGIFDMDNPADFNNDADAALWARRVGLASGSVDNLINIIENYHTPYFDPAEKSLNRYSTFMSQIVQSLQKDQDLDLSSWFGQGAGGLKNLMANTAYALRFIREWKAKIGKCESPNIAAMGAVPPAPIDFGGAPDECMKTPPTAAEKQQAQDAIDYMTPLLEAISMDPVVTPPPLDYQASIQAVIDDANGKYPGVAGLYYPGENVIGMSFNYLVGPGTIDVSNQVPKHTENRWINAWRVTCPDGGGEEGPTCETSPDWIACDMPDRTDLIRTIQSYLVTQGVDITGNCGGYEVIKRLAWVLRNNGAGYVATFHSSKCATSGMSGDLLGFSDGSSVDVFSLNPPPEPLTIYWIRKPGPPSTESGVYYVAPSDPGDPPGSY